MGEVLGGFEKLVLLAVLRLGAEAYGASIIGELEAKTGRPISPGAVYVGLRRLEAKGLMRSKTGDATPVRGGRAKRLYTVSRSGMRALREASHDWLAMTDGLENILGAKR